MNREPRFPDDWIAPGEFRYCNCGYTLLPVNVSICAKHRQHMDMELSDEQRGDKRREEILECERVSQQLMTDRLALSEKRRQEGMKPLFWMEK